MKQASTAKKTMNSKGASIFKKMLEDKQAIHEHLIKGGKLSDLKNKFRFAKPIHAAGK
jgi:hypothetical protein